MQLPILVACTLLINTLTRAQDVNVNSDSVSIDEINSYEDDEVFSPEEEEEEAPLNLHAPKNQEAENKNSNQAVYDDLLDIPAAEKEGISAANEIIGGQRKSVNYTIDFTVFDSTEGDGVEVPFIVEFDEVTYLNYTFVNNEDHNTTLIGLTGHVVDVETQETVANLTDGRLGPALVQPGANLTFSHPFQLNIAEGYYYLSPIVHVVIDGADQPIGVSVPQKVIDLQPGPVSFFSMSFLSILLTCGIMGLTTYNTYKKANAKNNNNKPELKKLAKTAKIDKNEWVPKEYKKQK